MTKFSTYLKSIITKYKIYFCLLFIVQILASIWKVAVDYSIKEIIDTIQSNTNITTLLMLFIFYKLMYHGMYFINRLLDIKYKPIILAETITNIYTKTLGHSLQ